jgi:hypothetical protein
MSTNFLAAALLAAVFQVDSGLAPGERPGPYSFVVSQGEKRGQLHCFVCEAEDRVMAIVFARDTSPQAVSYTHLTLPTN